MEPNKGVRAEYCYFLMLPRRGSPTGRHPFVSIRKRCASSLALIFVITIAPTAFAQVAADAQSKVWSAQWITVPGVPERDEVILHFRKPVEISQLGEHFVVDVSADNQFILFVNGQRVGNGPAMATWHIGDMKRMTSRLFCIGVKPVSGNGVELRCPCCDRADE